MTCNVCYHNSVGIYCTKTISSRSFNDPTLISKRSLFHSINTTERNHFCSSPRSTWLQRGRQRSASRRQSERQRCRANCGLPLVRVEMRSWNNYFLVLFSAEVSGGGVHHAERCDVALLVWPTPAAYPSLKHWRVSVSVCVCCICVCKCV